MTAESTRGALYVCPICGAEVLVLARRHGAFTPHCCNVPMEQRRTRSHFFVCPVCGAELAVVHQGTGRFEPRCCQVPMNPRAA